MKVNRLQRIVKGFSNHRRIEILSLLSDKSGIPLKEIAEILNVNMKTTSEHTRRMVSSGLITKTYRGSEVLHKITTRGRKVLKFLKSLDE